MKERKLNRLKHYNYSKGGYYCITICTQNKISYFGEIKNGKMILNSSGEIARRYWNEIPNYYSNIHLDEFIVMPNHIHGIIIINKSGRIEQCSVPTKEIKRDNRNYGLISKIIKSYKTIVMKTIRNEVRIHEFGWQRSFYDHIIRNEESLSKIREYIIDNPLKRGIDKNNIENIMTLPVTLTSQQAYSPGRG